MGHVNNLTFSRLLPILLPYRVFQVRAGHVYPLISYSSLLLLLIICFVLTLVCCVVVFKRLLLQEYLLSHFLVCNCVLVSIVMGI